MVYEDINTNHFVENKNKLDYTKASIENRFLAAFFDFLFFTPLVSFILSIVFSESYKIMQSPFVGAQASEIRLDLFLFGLIYFALLQSLCLFFMGTTPGQFFFGIELKFSNSKENYFLRILLRQLGYVVSALCLGLPLMAVYIDEEESVFYDRIVRCRVQSRRPPFFNEKKINFSELDKKQLSSGYSILTVGLFSIFLIAFALQHKDRIYTLKEKLAKSDSSINKKNCISGLKMSESEQLKSALILNISNKIEDDCVLSQADILLNSPSAIDSKEDSLAYLAKWYVYQKKSKFSQLRDEYHDKACTEFKFSFCEKKQDRQIASKVELNDEMMEWLSKESEDSP